MLKSMMMLLAILMIGSVATAGEPWPGEASDWHGFVRHDFKVDGRKAYVVEPEQAAPGRPWCWRMRFPGVAINDDLVLLKRGWHIAYIDMPNLFGSPKAIAVMDGFYDLMTGKHDLSKKPILKGLSRGGLFVFNYAAAHPDRVTAIYGDAPVCDFKSWPGGKGKGGGSAGSWKQLFKAYDFADEAEAMAYKKNPIDNLAPIAAAKIPVLIVAGDSDKVVPFEENGGLIESRYKALGGDITVILKPGCDHHPHGLPDDPAPILDFIDKHTK